MSKSLGNIDRAAGRHQGERRRHPAPLGVDERLPRGDPRQQGDPRARRRGVPQDPQHAALPARRTCTTSIRRPIACRSAQLEEVDRYILARYARRRANACCAAYDAYDYATIFQALNAVRDRRSERVLRRRLEGSAVHVRARGSRERRSAQTAMYLMADGLTRLLAPILSFTADELWRHLPGAREESVHLALFPAAGRARRAAPIRDLLERWNALIATARARCSPRSSRCARTSRSAARCRRRSCCRPRPAELRAARAVRARPADAVHRVGGRAAAGADDRRRRAMPRRHRARRRREVRALLALRAGGVDRAGVGRPLRPLPGRAGRDRSMSMTRSTSRQPARRRRRVELLVCCRWSSSRSIRSTKALVRATLPLHDERRRSIPGFLDFTHVRNTGAAFGILNARRLPVQDRRHRGHRDRGARRRRRVRGQPARTISWSRASAWRSSSAAPPAT